jgi:hypothetical protein
MTFSMSAYAALGPGGRAEEHVRAFVIATADCMRAIPVSTRDRRTHCIGSSYCPVGFATRCAAKPSLRSLNTIRAAMGADVLRHEQAAA